MCSVISGLSSRSLSFLYAIVLSIPVNLFLKFPINAKPCFVETNMSYEWHQISINIAFSLARLRMKTLKNLIIKKLFIDFFPNNGAGPGGGFIANRNRNRRNEKT